jgi:hypothetical protein
MAANRFTHLQSRPYVSSYVPLPLDLMYKGLAQKQGQFDAGVDDIKSTQELIKINADPHREAIRDQLLNKYNNEVNTLSEEFLRTGDPSVMNKVNRLKKDFANDSTRLGLEKSYANYTKLQKDAEEYKKANKYADFYNPYNTDVASKDGQFQSFDYQGMLAGANFNEEAKKQMGNIAEDGSDFNGMVRDKQGNLIIDPNGAYWKQNFGGSGVKEPKVVALAKAKADSFLQSEAGRFWLDSQLQTPVNYANLSPKQKLAAQEEAAKYLVQASAEQIGWKSKSGNDASFVPWAGDLRKEMAANETTSRQSEGMNNPVVDNPLKDLEFNKDGSLKAKTTGSSRPYTHEEAQAVYRKFGLDANGSGIGKSMESAAAEIAAGVPIENVFDMEANVANVQKIKEIQRNNPDLVYRRDANGNYDKSKPLTPKEVVEAYTNALKSLSNESIPLQSIGNVAAKGIGESIARNKVGRTFYIQDGNGETNTGDWKTTIDELDISEEEFDKALENGIGGYTQAGKTAGAYYIEVPTDKGKRRVIISPDAQMEKMFRTSNAVNNARKSMIPTTVSPLEDEPNYKISVTPDVKQDGTVGWKYEEIYTDNDGNVIARNPNLTIEDIREAERIKLKESNYLGSQVQTIKPNTTN